MASTSRATANGFFISKKRGTPAGISIGDLPDIILGIPTGMVLKTLNKFSCSAAWLINSLLAARTPPDSIELNSEEEVRLFRKLNNMDFICKCGPSQMNKSMAMGRRIINIWLVMASNPALKDDSTLGGSGIT